MFADLTMYFLSGADPAVVPYSDHSLTLEHGEVNLEFIAEYFILMGVRKEKLSHSGPGKK